MALVVELEGLLFGLKPNQWLWWFGSGFPSTLIWWFGAEAEVAWWFGGLPDGWRTVRQTDPTSKARAGRISFTGIQGESTRSELLVPLVGVPMFRDLKRDHCILPDQPLEAMVGR